MDRDEAQKLVFRHSTLRCPIFAADQQPGAKISEIEDTSLAMAVARGDLEEARIWMYELLHTFQEEWGDLEGWEGCIPGGKRLKDATQADLTAAKKSIRPDLYKIISDLKHTVRQLTLQIRRIEKDEERLSRVYTYLTGA